MKRNDKMRFQLPASGSIKSLEGQVLAASPQMDDPRFHRSVILVLHHAAQGAVGIVLNRPMSAAVEQEDPRAILPSGPKLFQGGPVGGSLIALQLAQNEPDGNGMTGNVYMVQKPDELKSINLSDHLPVRLFLGHAGWSAGQLEAEVGKGWWYPLDALPQLLPHDGHDMWVEAIRRVGREFYRVVLGIQDFPSDAQWN